MGSYVIDSSLFKDWYSTPRAREIFSDENLVQKWLDFEAALAQAQGEMNIIPAEAAAEIVAKADIKYLDLSRMKEKMDSCGHPMVPFVGEFKAVCDGEAGQYIHYATTTQDTMDTAMVLQLREIHAEILSKLYILRDNCKTIAIKNRGVIMAGRTHGQQALPITMGFKAAVWVSELERDIERMEECPKRVFTGQLSGGAGTLAGMDDRAIELVDRVMKKLRLNAPDISWHSARDRFAEFITLLGIVSATVARIGNEVYQLQKTEFSELAEPWEKGEIGSSTMPHKRNPKYCARIIALSKIIRNNIPLALECMVDENERDLRILLSEWSLIAQTCILTDAAVSFGVHITGDLFINARNMERNLGCLNGLMMSERLMFIVGKKVGRVAAHELIYSICMDTCESGAPLIDGLMENGIIRENFTREELDAALDPHTYTGHAEEYVDRVCGSE